MSDREFAQNAALTTVGSIQLSGTSTFNFVHRREVMPRTSNVVLACNLTSDAKDT